MAYSRRVGPLVGRASECATLGRLVADPASDQPQILVLRGDAGVGKTALLDFLEAQAADFRVTRIAGIESDMELAFAGLHQLCQPLFDHLDDLPEPQRNALGVAFGRAAGPTPDRFLVGLAVLGLMAAAAGNRPLLCVIDDAQWLDPVSLQTLSFVARRLLAEPVVMVFAARIVGADVLNGLPALTVEGLSDADARHLLDSVIVGRRDDRVFDRILAETRGNPLALIEVPRNISAAELVGGFTTSAARPSAGHVVDGYVRRIRALPRPTQLLVLAAAAEPVGDSALFLRTSTELGIPVDALAPAEDDGLLEFGPRLRFHHPLVRSAAYRAADLADRREVHRALADATDPAMDPDRRAWHAAHAASGPDDTVAAALEASAARAQERGGLAAAATFLERAATLTADPTRRASRALTAARAKREAAAPHRAFELLTIAELGPLTALQRAEATRMRAAIQFTLARVGETDAPPLSTSAAQLRSAAEQLEPLDHQLARDTYLEVFGTAMYAGRIAEVDAMRQAATATAAAMAGATPLDRPADLLLQGLSDHVLRGTGHAAIGAALQLWLAQSPPQQGQQTVRWMAPTTPVLQETAASEIWDDVLYHQIATSTAQNARQSGSLYSLPFALEFLAGSHLHAGEFSTAQSLLDEALAISQAVGHVPVKYHVLMLLAWRGDPDTTLPALDSARKAGTAHGEGRLLGMTEYATALLYNGLGLFEQAYAAARVGCEYDDLGVYGWCLSELIESAMRVGERDVASAALVRLQERAGASHTDWGLGMVASAQALVADDDTAEDCYTEAIERLSRTRILVQVARSHLRYGEWLRRRNRKAAARNHLRQAHDAFVQMGAAAFAERARQELVAAGARISTQSAGSPSALTQQEIDIARLVRDGLTNQEIGAQLFLSAHTVEWHLRKVFAKLGLTSRRQLRSWDG
ncbi:LuxR family transcriptional regulator [soil metagenome]